MSTIVTPQIEPDVLKGRIARFREVQAEIVHQVRRVIVGQEEVLEQVMIGQARPRDQHHPGQRAWGAPGFLPRQSATVTPSRLSCFLPAQRGDPGRA